MRRGVLVATAATLGLAGLGIGSTPAAAAGHHTFTVWPGHSIQAAIDKADPGDTIIVEPGTYHQSLLITTDGITLRGADSDDRNTVLEPPATPPPNLCTMFNGAASGICVLGQLDQQGNVLRQVHDDHITGLTIKNFNGNGNGIFGYGTDGLQVSEVSSFDNGAYGIARFVSTRTLYSDNSVSGNNEAGLYVGDSPDADTHVTDNKSWNNGYGIFVRHSHEVRVNDNAVWANCVGILVLDDGQPGGAGDIQVLDNNSRANNRKCPAGDGPPTSGGGIALIGAVRTVVADNEVHGNNAGGTVVSGGIVVESGHNGGSDPTKDSVRNNEAFGNAPADVIWDRSGQGNTFTDNECGASVPGHLCD